MATFEQLKSGDTISFETIAPSILQLKYTQVQFSGKVNWSVARAFADIAMLHRSLYPAMNQSEVKDDYRSYDYILFTDPEGTQPNVVQVLGVPWIRPETLVVSGYKDLSMIFSNISPDNKTYLFQLLRANGFSNFQVTET